MTLEDAEKMKELVVQPMIDAVKSELQSISTSMRADIKPLVDAKADHESRLQKIEGNQRKAMVGWGVFATGISAGLTATWQMVKGHFKVS